MRNTEIKDKILEFLKKSRIGASSSEIAKRIGHNRITISKYLDVMKAQKILDYQGIGQAKLWYIDTDSDRPCVVVVDDEPHVVDLVGLCLVPENYRVIKAYSGIEALKSIYQENPSLVILDLMMPEMDGYEVCRQIKSNPVSQHIPVIVLTAKGELDDKVNGLRMGADDYLVKPFDPVELEARVRRTIRKTLFDQDMHPLTKLPGRAALEIELQCWQTGFAANFRIQGLKECAEQHGYKKSDDILLLFSRLLKDQLKDQEHFFLAHLMRDDFIVLTKEQDAIDRIKASFKQLTLYFSKQGELTLSVKERTLDGVSRKSLNTNKLLTSLGVKNAA